MVCMKILSYRGRRPKYRGLAPLAGPAVVVALLSLTVLLGGCPYASEVPLSTPAKTVDPSIVGTWRAPDSDTSEVLLIAGFSRTEYVLVVADEPVPTVYRAFLSPLGDRTLLNVTEISPVRDRRNPYYFAEIQVRDDLLMFRLLDDELMDGRRFRSSEELTRFVETHVRDEALFGQWETLEISEAGVR